MRLYLHHSNQISASKVSEFDERKREKPSLLYLKYCASNINFLNPNPNKNHPEKSGFIFY